MAEQWTVLWGECPACPSQLGTTPSNRHWVEEFLIDSLIFFGGVLEFELRAYTLSHPISPFS
jgi:hypothetical protein